MIRLRELSIQAANGTVSGQDKNTLNQEFRDLINEVDRIARSTTFNGVQLLDGTGSTVSLQVGIGTVAGVDTIILSAADTLAATMGLSTLDIGAAGSQNAAIDAVDAAITTVNQIRGTFGAVQNRIERTIANLRNQVENTTAAESRIRDVDVAEETANLTRNSILQQAAVAILAQANVQPQIALQLLQ